jgi:hypothetical protein
MRWTVPTPTPKVEAILCSPWPVCLRPCQPGADLFLDHRALELGKYTKHLKHGFPGRRSGIETLLMEEQIDIKRV